MENRRFTVVFTNDFKKEWTDTEIESVIVKAYYYIIGFKKQIRISHIIDEALGKVYSDFDFDMSYSEKDVKYLSSFKKSYSKIDVEQQVLSYVRSIGGNLEEALIWIERQSF